MKAILTYIGAMIVLAPCLLVFNESSTILPNLIGFCYISILLIIFRGKVAKKAYKALIKANNSLGL
jgi:EamA domain-containing membrane protein RarD